MARRLWSWKDVNVKTVLGFGPFKAFVLGVGVGGVLVVVLATAAAVVAQAGHPNKSKAPAEITPQPRCPEAVC
jgi:hypothetical protein